MEVTGPGNVRREQEVTIRPGAQERLMVALRSVAVAPQATGVQPQRKSNRKIWIIAGIGGLGAAAAANALPETYFTPRYPWYSRPRPMLADPNDVLLSVASAVFCPVVKSLPPLSSHSDRRLSRFVLKPLEVRLLLFPVNTSTTLYPCKAESDGNADASTSVWLTPSPVRALVYTAE